jgi:hypothetical protein
LPGNTKLKVAINFNSDDTGKFNAGRSRIAKQLRVARPILDRLVLASDSGVIYRIIAEDTTMTAGMTLLRSCARMRPSQHALSLGRHSVRFTPLPHKTPPSMCTNHAFYHTHFDKTVAHSSVPEVVPESQVSIDSQLHEFALKSRVVQLEEIGNGVDLSEVVAVPLPGEASLTITRIQQQINDMNNAQQTERQDRQKERQDLKAEIQKERQDRQKERQDLKAEIQKERQDLKAEIQKERQEREMWQTRAGPWMETGAWVEARQLLLICENPAILTYFGASKHYIKHSNNLKHFSDIFKEAKAIRQRMVFPLTEHEQFFLDCFKNMKTDLGPGVEEQHAITTLIKARNEHAHPKLTAEKASIVAKNIDERLNISGITEEATIRLKRLLVELAKRILANS